MTSIRVDCRQASVRDPNGRFETRWVFPIMTLLLGLTYSSVIFLRYTLSDENWIIRASDWWLRFDLRQGRPLFSLAIYATSRLHDRIGFDVVRVLRIGAVVGLAGAMSLLVVWLERWGVKRIHAVLTMVVVASLPPFQIYVVDATWLVIPFVSTIMAVFLMHRAFDATRGRGLVLALAIVLIVASLMFYQPAMLIGFGMLSVPLLWLDVRDHGELKRRVRFVMAASSLLAASIVVYYGVWLGLWWFFEDHAMHFYGPMAFSTDPFGRLRFLFSYRLMQVLNLWYVDFLRPTWFFYGSLMVIAAGAIADLLRALTGGQRRQGVAAWGIKCVGVAALLVASDSIPLAAEIQIWSYVTTPALCFVATVLLASSIRGCLGSTRRLSDQILSGVLGVAAIAGVFMAQYTVLTYFAVPLSVENQIVKYDVQEYLKTHRTLTRVHVLGRQEPLAHGWFEYSWANSLVDVYIRDMVKNVLDDVGVPSEIEVTQTGAAATQLPPGSQAVPADALVIDLSRIHLR